MSVTGGGLQDFVWYTVVSTITRQRGYWTFYDTSVVNGVHPASIRIDFATEGTDIGSATVTVVNPADTSYLNYLSWTSMGVNKTFEAYDALKPETIRISWNETTEAGNIENVTTQEKACWGSKDVFHKDILCAN